jgi:hypothetical protein
MGEELTIVRKLVPAPSPTMRDLLAVVFRQCRLAVLCFVGIFLAMTLCGVLAPSYQARLVRRDGWTRQSLQRPQRLHCLRGKKLRKKS